MDNQEITREEVEEQAPFFNDMHHPVRHMQNLRGSGKTSLLSVLYVRHVMLTIEPIYDIAANVLA